MIFGIFAALSRGMNEVLYMHMLKFEKIDYKAFNIMTFFGIALCTFPFALKHLRYLDSRPVVVVSILTLGVLCVLSGVFKFKALKYKKIEDVEPLMMSSWIFTIVLSFIFFPAERNVMHLLLALVVSCAIISLKMKKHHLKIDKYSAYLLLAALFFSIQYLILGYLIEYILQQS